MGRDSRNTTQDAFAGTVLEDPKEPRVPGEIVVEIPGLGPIQARPYLPVGVFACPRKDDLVTVSFVGGQAYWTAVVYPPNATPRTHDGQEPTHDHALFASRKGQVLCLNDKPGDDAQGAHLKDLHGNILSMTRDGITLTCGNTSLQLKPSGDIVLKAGPTELVVSAVGGVTVGGQRLALAEPLLTFLRTASNGGGPLAPPLPPAPLDSIYKS